MLQLQNFSLLKRLINEEVFLQYLPGPTVVNSILYIFKLF